jgi:hypothetical protein
MQALSSILNTKRTQKNCKYSGTSPLCPCYYSQILAEGRRLQVQKQRGFLISFQVVCQFPVATNPTGVTQKHLPGGRCTGSGLCCSRGNELRHSLACSFSRVDIVSSLGLLPKHTSLHKTNRELHLSVPGKVHRTL